MSSPALERSPATKEVALVQAPDSMLAMIERFVSDPAIDVNKLEKLVELHERTQARTSEAMFNAAMSAAQQQIRPIEADASNPQTKSRYASYAQLDRALRPIYTDHGFGLSFDTTDSPLQEHVRVLCYVTNSGHARTYRVDMPADGKGAKGGDVMTKTHAAGSAMSYGMRYLLKLIFNVAVGEDDDDGNKAAGKQQPEREIVAPDGFASWLADMDALVDGGADWTAYSEAWNGSKESFRLHLAKSNKDLIEAWKKAAASRTVLPTVPPNREIREGDVPRVPQNSRTRR